MKLVIVESPAKSKTISKYLGSEYKVLASIGHVRDLPKSNKKAIDIPGGFIPHYEISKGKEKVVAEIKAAAKKADEILLATDPDREGEAIAWHLSEIITEGKKEKRKDIKRVTYHEITKEAVEEAFKHPRDIDENLKEAQEARRVLDRLVGYDLSGLIWKKVRYGLSAGRVQSPALRIIMEREREIRAFKPEGYWVVTAKLSTEKKEEILFTCTEEPKTEKEAASIVETGKNNGWRVVSVEESQVKRSPRPPFITSTLQQAASSRLGFAPSRTMGIAQKLYESGLITYMRTDSITLSGNAISQINNIVEKKFGKGLFLARKFTSKSKNAQEAHEAIRPTDFSKDSAGINDEQKKLYNLIWSRTVASQMQDAEMMRTRVLANVGEPRVTLGIPDFAANGQRVVSPGWLLADIKARGEDVELPKMKAGDSLNLLNIGSEGKQTEPPGRYSEAGLIKELEKRGIGRPSTYASTIKTIVDRGYVEKDGKALKPTDTGDVVSTFLENNFEKYIGDTFTADMEDELDDIALGKRKYEPTLREFYGPFLKDVKSKDKIDKLTTLGDVDPQIKCPICGKGMVIKLGRGGKFMSCETFPDCKGMRTILGEIIEEAKPIGVDPTTDLPIYVMDGRFGPYVQLGEKGKKEKGKKEKLRMASIPKEKNPHEVTVEEALHYLSLPRLLGNHPETGKPISANIGRFGPYVVHEKDFRSLKEDDVYKVTFERALEIFSEPKKFRRGRFAKKEES
ncbi:MAG TPA: type I DNA topoisomerase [Candidatus Paceibacterota bacterium]